MIIGMKHSIKSKKLMSIAHMGKPKVKGAYTFPKGSTHPMWKGGRTMRNHYVYILNWSHPFCSKQGYVFEHRIIMEKKIGRYLSPKERIHHINEIKTDNRIKNLMLFADDSAHRRFHNKMKSSN